MSLVAAYGSSDSESEEEINEKLTNVEIQNIPEKNINELKSTESQEIKTQDKVEDINNVQNIDNKSHILVNNVQIDDVKEKNLDFGALPKPKATEDNDKFIEEADLASIPKKINYGNIEKPPKKEKGPTRITIPSLSDFKDMDDEHGNEDKRSSKPSQKGSGLIGMLPPPKSATISTKANSMVPHILTKKPMETNKLPSTITVTQTIKRIQKPTLLSKPMTSTLKSLSSYNSDSEEEEDKGTSSGMDFFSLSTPTKISYDKSPTLSKVDIEAIAALSSSNTLDNIEVEVPIKEDVTIESDKRLVSNVMNLPKEEIILKNKAEVGPKLPVPEQEYNVDSHGNVAFDEKAIEYLCGKRGVKRKNEFNNVDIVEINGEDIKPDEREWLVKALTEEPVRRPISAGSGPSGQSKKKHQITYLAHQAKAMELELKSQWAQNKASRQQTRSKYGF